MANLKSLKLRIKSVKSTQKMTKAMKMVAASKLRRAKNLVESSRPYAEKIGELMSYLAANIAVKRIHDERFPLLNGTGSNKVHLVVILSSDRGLCGGLNTSVVKYAKTYINHLISSHKEVKIICIGKKAYDQLRNHYGDKIINHISGIFKNNIDYKTAENVTKIITDLFDKKEFDVCDIVYSKFKSAIAQEAVIKQLIPASTHLDNENYKTKRHRIIISHSPIHYEPNKEELLAALLPKSLVMQVYNELLETSASEQGARMAAMEAATNNAGKMIKNLTLVYNRTRQSNITKELIDIVSGANVV
jgi:F-type H+-transporting ATPase subunit gamma